MAIDIKFDLVGNPEPPTIILANRNGNKIGQLKVDVDNIELSNKFNDASELSFTIHKKSQDLLNSNYIFRKKTPNHYLLEDTEGLYYILEDSDNFSYL